MPIDLKYDYSGVFVDPARWNEAQLQSLAPRLAEVHARVVADAAEFAGTGPRAASAEAWEAGFIDQPARLLDGYAAKRKNSELGRILEAAKALRELVDRIVVLGSGGMYHGAKALTAALCDPLHNELSRGDRGSRPRIYFAGDHFDNDATQALLRLLGRGKQAETVADRWGLVVIDKSGDTLETAVVFRVFLGALRQSCGGDATQAAKLILPVTGENSKLHQLAQALGCSERFDIPEGIGDRCSIFTAAGLLPASLMGIDIVKLLQGARKMTEYFRESSDFAANVVLQFVGVGHLLEQASATTRGLSIWGKRLECVGNWYDQLLGKTQQGSKDRFITNVFVERPCEDRLAVAASEHDEDDLNRFAGKTLPELLRAARLSAKEALHADRQPTADLSMPTLDEDTLGQLLQMKMLATTVGVYTKGIERPLSPTTR